MTRTKRFWIALRISAFASALFASCYDHGGQTEDGQSHWLRTCHSAQACDKGELCACGVCTRPCKSDGACGDDAKCVELGAEGPRCESGGGNVCLQRCELDRECSAESELLSCEQRTCVATSQVTRDAGSVARDAGARVPDPPSIAADPRDAGPDAGTAVTAVSQDSGPDTTKIDTVDGRLPCFEARARVIQLIEDRLSQYTSCETELDCACADSSTRCESGCSVVIGAAESASFAATVADISQQYCSDPNLENACPQMGVVDCNGCAPSCVGGDCQNAPRNPCDRDGKCPGNQLCHIDNTCIERGALDENGVEVLAVAAEPWNAQYPYRFGITGFAVTDDALFWQDEGTYVGATHIADGAVYRMALAEGTIDVYASGLPLSPSQFQVDAARVYFSAATGIWAVALYDNTMTVRLVDGKTDWTGNWAVGGQYLYYATLSAENLLRRVRVDDGSGDEPFFDAGSPLRSIAADGTSVFVEVREATSTVTRVVQVDATNGAMSVLVEHLHDDDLQDGGPLLLSDGSLIADGNAHTELRGYALADGAERNIASSGSQLNQRSASAGYVYYWENQYLPNSGDERYYVARSPLMSPYEPERLQAARATGGHIAEAAGYLYWVERGRLLRKQLPH